MAHSPLFQSLKLWTAQAAAAEQLQFDRRTFLRLAAGAAAAPFLRAQAPAPNVAIVGAGLAGLTCAYRLRKSGIQATVFEASQRTGGRCFTLRGAFEANQRVERGAELIDSDHTEIRNLARELGLKLDNLLKAEKRGTSPSHYFHGQPYPYPDAERDFRAFVPKLAADMHAAGPETSYKVSTARGRELDNMSLQDWIDQNVPGGGQSPLGLLLDIGFTTEYGAPLSEQSSLNLIYVLGEYSAEWPRIYDAYPDRYRIRGGNDSLAARLTGKLKGQIRLNHPLTAIERRETGGYTLRFDGHPEATADHIVLALPFSVLRHSVDLSKSGFSERKLTAIRELGMGNNAKMHLQFKSRHWEKLGSTGETYADTGYQCTWDQSRAQKGRPGLLVNFLGAGAALAIKERSPELALQQLEPVLPGITAEWNGRVRIDNWPGNPWSRGAYSFYRPGQFTEFGGVEGEPENNAHFCGEHTSSEWQGFMNGAVATGERAAREILGV